MLKICTKCGIPKPTEGFNSDRTKIDGLYSSCRDCQKLFDKTRFKSPKRKEDNNTRNRKYYTKTRSERYRNNPVLYLYDVAKKRAKKLNVPFLISPEDIILNEYCPIFGIKLDVLTNKASTGMSLDRIDNELGYVPGNVAIISRKANRLKGDGTVEQFKRIISYMNKEIF